MRFAWRKLPPENGSAERRLISEARRLGETMTLMVGRMETLVERLHEELKHHEGEGGSGERRL